MTLCWYKLITRWDITWIIRLGYTIYASFENVVNYSIYASLKRDLKTFWKRLLLVFVHWLSAFCLRSWLLLGSRGADLLNPFGFYCNPYVMLSFATVRVWNICWNWFDFSECRVPRLGRCGRPRCLPDLVDVLRDSSVADACCGARCSILGIWGLWRDWSWLRWVTDVKANVRTKAKMKRRRVHDGAWSWGWSWSASGVMIGAVGKWTGGKMKICGVMDVEGAWGCVMETEEELRVRWEVRELRGDDWGDADRVRRAFRCGFRYRPLTVRWVV